MKLQIARQSIKQASFIIAAIAIVSQGLGVIREALVANYLGTSAEYDLLLISMAIPMMIANLFFMSIPSGAIPYLQIKKDPSAIQVSCGLWPFLRINSLLILIISITVFLALPSLRWILGEGLSDSDLNRIIIYGRIFCLVIPLKAYEGLFRALLHLRHNFLFPAMTIVGFNFAMILILITLFPSAGVPAFIIAWITGVIIQALIVAIPSYLLYRKISGESGANGNFASTAYLRYLGVIALVESFGLIIDPFDRYMLGNLGGGGLVSANYYAVVLSTVPMRIFVYAVGTAIFPSLSERIANDRSGEAARLYHKSLIICLVLIPTALYLYLFNNELIKILFERGEFTEESRLMTSRIFKFYLAGIVFQALFFVQLRTAYALKARKHMIESRLMALIIKVSIGLILINSNWALAVGGGTAIMFLANFAFMEIFLIIKHGLKYTAEDLRKLSSAILGSVAISVAILALYHMTARVFGPGDISMLSAVGIGGLVVFLLLERKFSVYGIWNRNR